MERMIEALQRAAAGSPADATELVLLERRRGKAATGEKPRAPRAERTLLVRVLESGRIGLYQSGSAEPAALEAAVRQALANARSADPGPVWPEPCPEPVEMPEQAHYDEAIAALTPSAAGKWLEERLRRGERGTFGWVEGRVAVVTAAGHRRGARATAATLRLVCGEGPGAGRAAASARSLRGLGEAGVEERARSRTTNGAGGAEPGPAGLLPAGLLSAGPVVLSPEAAAALLAELNRVAFTAGDYERGESPLFGKLGERLFDPSLQLLDDGLDPAGLPFPFDLEGSAKRRVALIADGVAMAPALSARLARELGREPTPHAVGGGECRASNLFLEPGTLRLEELLARADGGVWIGALERVACHDRQRLAVRGAACGVRRIREGRLAEPLADGAWEASLFEALSKLAGLGAETVCVAAGDGLFGGVSAPAVVIS